MTLLERERVATELDEAAQRSGYAQAEVKVRWLTPRGRRQRKRAAGQRWWWRELPAGRLRRNRRG